MPEPTPDQLFQQAYQQCQAGNTSEESNVLTVTVETRGHTFHLPDVLIGTGLSLVVTSDQPVVVESALYLSDPRYGAAASPGVPIAGDLPFPETVVAAKPPPTTTTTAPPPAPGSTETAGPGATTTPTG